MDSVLIHTFYLDIASSVGVHRVPGMAIGGQYGLAQESFRWLSKSVYLVRKYNCIVRPLVSNYSFYAPDRVTLMPMSPAHYSSEIQLIRSSIRNLFRSGGRFTWSLSRSELSRMALSKQGSLNGPTSQQTPSTRAALDWRSQRRSDNFLGNSLLLPHSFTSSAASWRLSDPSISSSFLQPQGFLEMHSQDSNVTCA